MEVAVDAEPEVDIDKASGIHNLDLEFVELQIVQYAFDVVELACVVG